MLGDPYLGQPPRTGETRLREDQQRHPAERPMADYRAGPAEMRGRSELGARWRLLLLRAFELKQADATVSVSAGAQRVLAFLALSDRPLGRAHVAGVLWPDTSDKRAGGSLRSAIWDLRLAGHDLLETSGGCLRLAPQVEVDFQSALALAGPILDARQPCPEAFAERDLLHHDLLSDWYDDWVMIERERFRQLRLHLLEALCDRLIRGRRLARAVDAGVTAVAAEPLRESAQRALIRAHLAEGNRSEALRQYEAYRTLLREELDLEPSTELLALVGLAATR